MFEYSTPFDRWLPAVWRGRIYALLAPLQAGLVSFGVLNDNTASLGAALLSALLGFGLAASNAHGTWRQWLYGLLAPAQALLVGYGIFTDSQLSPLIALVATVLGLGVAAAKTPVG